MGKSPCLLDVISESILIGKDVRNWDRSFWLHYAFEICPDLGGVRLSAEFLPAIVFGLVNGLAQMAFGCVSCTFVSKSVRVFPTAS